tara:strand:+ start:113 stop:319 length:207 start_codon:yes stop_codon:yes gene_type:complete
MITNQNSGIQWEQNAKDKFCRSMELLMTIMVQKVERTRNGTRRRITDANVDSVFLKELQKAIMVGEEE